MDADYQEVPPQMRALTLDAENRTAKVLTVPTPQPGPTEVLVRVHAIALNPVDALYVAHPLGQSGRIVGSDFSGTVITLGNQVPISQMSVGESIAGFLQGACSINDRPGAFAEYVAIPWDLVWKIGDLPFEKAAGVSLCALTAAQMLRRLGVSMPCEELSQAVEVESMFINGATTSVGLFAAQLAKQAIPDVELYGTASEKHFTTLMGPPFSYTQVVSYREPATWRTTTHDGTGVSIALDCISEGETVRHTAEVLSQPVQDRRQIAVVRSRQGGAWNTPVEQLRTEPSYGAVWEGLGEDVEYMGMTLPANVSSRAFTVAFYRWLSQGQKLVPVQARIMPGGLKRVVADGFALMGTGTMTDRTGVRKKEYMRPASAEKLVYLI